MIKLFSAFVFLIILNVANGQRNVVLIIADDLGTDYCGFYENYGDTAILPNLRSLLSKGIRFQNAMSNPLCSATRSTILTGRYGFRTGVGNVVGGTGGSGQLDTNEITIPKLLNTFNPSIAKAQIGKWHLNNAMPAALRNPIRFGYDHYEGPFIGQLPSYTNWTKITADAAVATTTSNTVTTYATTENVNNAINWIKSINNNSFFLWLAFNAPHEPLHLPPANLHTYTTLTGTTANINAQPKQYFKAMLQAMDHEIGRLFDSLKTMNKFDSTDFIFIGDNGNSPRTAQIADLTKTKGTVYQYGVHEPMIISGPAVVNPGRVSDALINLADIFATVLELFGYTNWATQIPANKPVDSKSILPIITNNLTIIRPWSFTEIFKTTTDSSDGKAMRNLEYKLIKFDYGKQALYQLTDDPEEINDLLTGPLTTTDISNYNYLCNEMLNLTGSGSACQNFVLPINNFSFNGYQENNKNILIWFTDNNTGYNYFEIEKSKDGIHFNKIGTKFVNTFTTPQNNYLFEDLFPENGLSFYRIKIYKHTGLNTYSKIISIAANQNNSTFNIFPNPSYNLITIKAAAVLTKDMQVIVTNSTGEVVVKKALYKGKDICIIDASAFKNGTYFINFDYNGVPQSHKIVVAK